MIPGKVSFNFAKLSDVPLQRMKVQLRKTITKEKTNNLKKGI